MVARQKGAGALQVLLLALAVLAHAVGGQHARGRVSSRDIREASGLAASRKHKSVLYTHNDSGDRSRVFLINEWGSYLGTYEIQDAQARDWEDIAVGPGPVPGQDYLYIGDIGDNRAYYPTKAVYRVKEPNATSDPLNQQSKILTGVEKFEFRFPGHAGNANAETLLVDPHTGDLFIVRKTRQHPLQVFWARAPLARGAVIDLEEYHVTCVDYDQECKDQHHNSPSKGELVGGDISPSGLGLLIKSYSAVYYWRRSNLEDSFFDSDPRILPYRSERQGEAICWDSTEKGYFTLSEGRNQMLYYYPYQPHSEWLDTVQRWRTGFRWNDAMESSRRPSRGETRGAPSEPRTGAFQSVAAEAFVFSWDGHRKELEPVVTGKLVNDTIVFSDEECLDIPTPNGSSCAEEAAAGNCELPWMRANGFCRSSCGTCAGGLESQGRGRQDVPVPVDSWWNHWMSTREGAAPQQALSSQSLDDQCAGSATGSYVGSIVAVETAAGPSECCSLCSEASRGGKKCDTWSLCKDRNGCSRFGYGTCLLKRSVTYEFRQTQKWASGYLSRGARDQNHMVLGVRSGPEEAPIDWASFFEDYANETWMKSMYYLDMDRQDFAWDPQAPAQEEDWLCQEDLGVLTCPEKRCHALRGHYKGLIVAEIDFASVARCCEACTQAREHKIPPHNLGCDVYSFCAKKEGCGLMQPYGSCLLKVISEDPQLGLAWSFDPMKPFTSGKIGDN
ncbi:hypothetical protein HOP50_01g05760 [Chloropicon primus]|nr:hypothetical protein HOP50_01g05760 [Chloropicon primus]